MKHLLSTKEVEVQQKSVSIGQYNKFDKYLVSGKS